MNLALVEAAKSIRNAVVAEHDGKILSVYDNPGD